MIFRFLRRHQDVHESENAKLLEDTKRETREVVQRGEAAAQELETRKEINHLAEHFFIATGRKLREGS